MATLATKTTCSAIPRYMDFSDPYSADSAKPANLEFTKFGWDYQLFEGVITNARQTLDCNVTKLILLTLIKDLINTYKKSQIIEDLGNLFNDENTLEKPDKIEKFITSENILNITEITKEIRIRKCTNREILYCIQMLCKKTYTIC